MSSRMPTAWAEIALRLWVRDALASSPGGDHYRALAELERLTGELADCSQRATGAEQRAASLERELAAVKASRTWRTAEHIQRIRRRVTWKR